MSPICHFLALNPPMLAIAPSGQAKLLGQAWGPRVARRAGALGPGSRQGALLPFCLSFSPSPVCAEPSLAQKPVRQSGASERVVDGMN